MNPLSLYHQNVNGLRSKLTDYKMAIEASSFDIYAFTETNLQPDIATGELFNNDYIVFRHDRVLTRTPKKDGGGVLIAVKSSVGSVQEINISNTSAYIEGVCIKIQLKRCATKCNFRSL